MLGSARVNVTTWRAGGRGLFRRVVKITGRPESEVDAVAQPVYATWVSAPIPIATTILAKMGQIELHLTADAPAADQADVALERAVTELVAVLGPSVYSVDGSGLEAVIGDLLIARHMTPATHPYTTPQRQSSYYARRAGRL